MDILVIDIGGSSVKLWHTGHEEHRKFDSGKSLTPDKMIEGVKETIGDWTYEAVAIGIPTRVSKGRIVEDPQNLGPGWVGYHFASALGYPIRVMNDASLQALGSYDGGRMLFLGLGTAVGSTLVSERLVLSLDLGRLKLGDERVWEMLGDAGFETLGAKKWRQLVHEIVPSLKYSLMADYAVLGGGNVKELDELPDGVRRGNNRSVVEGGRRLWEELPDPANQKCDEWMIL